MQGASVQKVLRQQSARVVSGQWRVVKETKRIEKETETDWQTIWQSESRSSRQHVFVEESPRQVRQLIRAGHGRLLVPGPPASRPREAYTSK